MAKSSSDNKGLDALADAAGLEKSELKVLSRALQSALNIKMISRFRWQSSLDPAKVEEAAALQLFQHWPVPTAFEGEEGEEQYQVEGRNG